MSKKQKNETSAKAPVKLTRAEKKEIQAVIRKYKGDGKPHSAQASIPYEAMYQDGVCRVTPRTFSKCIEFTDISYQLAQADTKTAIFENLCDLYNYLDASIHVQFSFINRKIDPKQYAKSFEIRAQGDDFDDIRSEYSDILQEQLVNGNNGLMKRKFMTYTIEADNLKMARARLRRIETDLLGYFKSMGASAWGLDAKQRLEVMHSIFHPDGEPFSFDWKWLAPSGLSTKDFIAPSSFRFGNARMFGLGGKYGALGDLASHTLSLSQYLIGDIAEVCGMTKIIVPERPDPKDSSRMLPVENDDVVQFMFNFANGACGTIFSNRLAAGRKMSLGYEIQLTNGCIVYNQENQNQVQIYRHDDPKTERGFKTVLIAPGHGEYDKFYGGAGICLGYADQKTIEVHHTLRCAAEHTPCEIDFRFGMKVMQVIDAVLESAETRQWVTVK